MEEKDKEPLMGQSIGLPPKPILPSTSYYGPLIVADSVSSPAFNLLPYLSPLNEKLPLSSPPSVSEEKGKLRTEAPPTISCTADLPHPSAATTGITIGTSSGAPLGSGQLKLERLARYFIGQKPSARAWLVEVE